MKNLLFFTLLLLSFSSCLTETDISERIVEEGLKPIYAESETWKTVRTLEAQPIKKLGKIYYKDQLIYVSESLKGIHIIDNSDPTNPVKIKFIEIIGNRDIAIKGNILYADNVTDLVTLDISDLDNIRTLGRVENIYPQSAQTHPEGYTGSFECVDTERGIVIGWEEATLTSPDCRR